jgi:hypothetical protein
MTFPYKWFRFPWAVAGTKTSPPDPTQGDGTCSYDEGFGADYSLDPATNPSALLIPRDKTNGLYNDITTALQYFQKGKVAFWIDATTNGGSSYAYDIGDTILYTDGVVYQSLVATNTTTPGTDPTKWSPISFQGVKAHGQCRLSVTSATVLTLSPYNGNGLNIGGVFAAIPSAGITIANTGLTANTKYYVYAFLNSGVPALELSATGHSTNTANGVEIKTGDASRTLVGMIQTSNNTPGQFVDSATQRFCANWFNRRLRSAMNIAGSSLGAGSGTVDISPSNHSQVMTWAQEVIAYTSGNFTGSLAGGLIDMGVGIDGTANNRQTGINVYVAGYFINYSVPAYALEVTEGLHYATGVASTDVTVSATFQSIQTTLTAFI